MLLIDAQTAGVAGDMLLSALVDLGADRKKVIGALYSCSSVVEWFKVDSIEFRDVSRSGFRAVALDAKYSESHERKGVEVYDAIARCSDHLGLDNKAREFALNSIDELIKAEARIHNEDYVTVHFHEISSIDTILDIIGTAVALSELDAFTHSIYSSKVAVGGGYTEFSHGKISNPVPAVLEILKGKKFTLVGGPVEEELSTPTGVAMLVSLAECSLELYPAFECLRIGYGAGSKSLDHMGIPNILRVILARESSVFMEDSIMVLESNIDDADGEELAELTDRLYANNAKDVSIISAVGKKGRPAYILRVLCSREDMSSILDLIVKGSGTLGIRVHESYRYILPRSILHIPIRVMDNEYTVRVKVARDTKGNIIHYKVEHDDISRVSKELNISYRLTESIINKEVHDRVYAGRVRG